MLIVIVSVILFVYIAGFVLLGLSSTELRDILEEEYGVKDASAITFICILCWPLMMLVGSILTRSGKA